MSDTNLKTTMKRSYPIFTALLILLQLGACVTLTPGVSTPEPSASQEIPTTQLVNMTLEVVETQVMQATTTPNRLVTQTKKPDSATLTPSPTEPQPTPAPTIACNRAAPGNPIDITIPDDTALLPRQAFSKTWRLQNIGTCTWTKEYAYVWFSGDHFEAPREILFSGPVYPGDTVDITIDLRAPKDPGSYQGNWKLRNGDGELFGIGPNGNAPFWVSIIVLETETPAPSPVPTTAATATPEIITNTILNLKPSDMLDLDSSQKNLEDGSDIQYSLNESGSYHMLPLNEARLGAFYTNLPSREFCIGDGFEGSSLDVSGSRLGNYFCYRTNLGLPGWGRIVYFDDQNGALALEILTWSLP